MTVPTSRPICLPCILRTKKNPSYIVGGTFEIAAPNPSLGYALKTAGFIHNDRLMLIAEIRLYANNGTLTIYTRTGAS